MVSKKLNDFRKLNKGQTLIIFDNVYKHMSKHYTCVEIKGPYSRVPMLTTEYTNDIRIKFFFDGLAKCLSEVEKCKGSRSDSLGQRGVGTTINNCIKNLSNEIGKNIRNHYRVTPKSNLKGSLIITKYRNKR